MTRGQAGRIPFATPGRFSICRLLLASSFMFSRPENARASHPSKHNGRKDRVVANGTEKVRGLGLDFETGFTLRRAVPVSAMGCITA